MNVVHLLRTADLVVQAIEVFVDAVKLSEPLKIALEKRFCLLPIPTCWALLVPADQPVAFRVVAGNVLHGA